MGLYDGGAVQSRTQKGYLMQYESKCMFCTEINKQNRVVTGMLAIQRHRKVMQVIRQRLRRSRNVAVTRTHHSVPFHLGRFMRLFIDETTDFITPVSPHQIQPARSMEE